MIHNSNSNLENKYNLEMNEFGDLTTQEFVTITGENEPWWKICDKISPNEIIENKDKLPEQFDWRNFKIGTNVQNQLRCSTPNCKVSWSFACVSAIEDLMKITHGIGLEFSVQQALGCAEYGACTLTKNYFRFPATCYNYVKHHGLCMENEYPYVGENGTCHQCTSVVHINGCHDIDMNGHTENAMMRKILDQPLSVSINGTLLQFYKSGIINANNTVCNQYPSHDVTIIGYGKIGNSTYFILKNSFGDSWGEAGYFRVEAFHNTCGIAMSPNYPIDVTLD